MSSMRKRFSTMFLAITLVVLSAVIALPQSVSAVNKQTKAEIFCNEKLYLENHLTMRQNCRGH